MAPILLATINAKWIHPSLALRLLKANLGDLEGEAEILEFALRQPREAWLDPIIRAAPRILGLSVSIWNHRATVELLRALWERRDPGNPCIQDRTLGNRPVIVLGGPEVSYLPEDAELFRYADWVVRGEGELVFRELCQRILGRPGDGSQSGTIKGKFITAFPVDLDRLAPAYKLYTDEDLRRKLVYLEAARGCPFRCEFCLSAADIPADIPGQGQGRRRVREFPLTPFLAQIGALIDRGCQALKFLDRTFNANIPRAIAILDFLLDRLTKQSEPSFYVHLELVPRSIPPELGERLARFPPGSLRLELGIQTLNPQSAALIGRHIDGERELETLRFLRCQTSGIIHADLIAGLPGEDAASFAQGFDRLWVALTGAAADYQIDGLAEWQNSQGSLGMEIQLGILKLLPGAPIARHTEAFGMRYAAEPPYEVLETAALSAGDLDRIKNFARFWELIVNRHHFPDLAARILPPGEPVFWSFMARSDWLLRRFGRNWGIDRKELRAALETMNQGKFEV